jgi:hypothetical protein
MMFDWQWSQIVHEKAVESFIWSSDRIRVRLYEAKAKRNVLYRYYGDGRYIENPLLSDGLESNYDYMIDS